MDEKQRDSILGLIEQGVLDTKDIAQEVGVSPFVVAAVRAHRTMGRYEVADLPRIVDEELEEASKLAFSLEMDMQAALRSNIQQLEAGLTIADGGKERKTAAGFIDITAKDAAGRTVVLELKAGQAGQDALTQIMAYVGAVLEEEGVAPRALLVASGFHQKVVFAAKAIPGLELVNYGFKFEFERLC